MCIIFEYPWIYDFWIQREFDKVRVISVLLGCLKGTGLLIYLVLWIIMPYNENEDMYEDDDVENLKSANINDEDKKSSSKNKEQNSSKKEGMHSDQEFNDYFQK